MRVDLPPDRPQVVRTAKDGSSVILSPVGQSDRHLLELGLQELSDSSRYTRFGHGRVSLSERELDYLVDLDQRRHVAWGASVEGEGAGIGRYILLDDERCAEVAVTVIDRFQRMGIGGLLLRALVAVARSDKVEMFCFSVVPENEVVTGMLTSMGVGFEPIDGVMEGTLALDHIPVDDAEQVFVGVMEAAREL